MEVRTRPTRARHRVEIMSERQDYWQAAAALKRCATLLKIIVPQVRRLDAINDPAERRGQTGS